MYLVNCHKKTAEETRDCLAQVSHAARALDKRSCFRGTLVLADSSATRMHLKDNAPVLHIRKAARLNRRVSLSYDGFDALVNMGPHVRVVGPLPEGGARINLWSMMLLSS